MVPFLIILAVVVLIFYLLFAPIEMGVDTKSNSYFLKYGGIFKAILMEDKEELVKVRLRMAFLNFYFYPLKEIVKKKEAGKKLPQARSKRRKQMKIKTLGRLIRSFTIKQFNLNLDTGDCVRNARLYPLFVFLNRYRGGFHINYLGENSLLLRVENRPVRIIKSFINL